MNTTKTAITYEAAIRDIVERNVDRRAAQTLDAIRAQATQIKEQVGGLLGHLERLITQLDGSEARTTALADARGTVRQIMSTLDPLSTVTTRRGASTPASAKALLDASISETGLVRGITLHRNKWTCVFCHRKFPSQRGASMHLLTCPEKRRKRRLVRGA